MGRRRVGQRLAEGPDAAARDQLQRALAEGAGGQQDGDLAEGLLGLGRDRRDEQGRLLALDAEHQPAVRALRSARHDPRAGPRHRLRAAPALGRRRAQRGARLGPADPVRRPGRLLAGADRRRHAGRRRRRRDPQADPRSLRPVARHRPRQGARPDVPDRPPRRLQRPHPDGRARRRRDGPEARAASRSPAAACRRRWSSSRRILRTSACRPPPERASPFYSSERPCNDVPF